MILKLYDLDDVFIKETYTIPSKFSGKVIHPRNNLVERFLNGERHSINEPAILYPTGRKEWWQYGKLHRIGGPAVELPGGHNLWYRRGKLHREDGYADERFHDYWINGEFIEANNFESFKLLVGVMKLKGML